MNSKLESGGLVTYERGLDKLSVLTCHRNSETEDSTFSNRQLNYLLFWGRYLVSNVWVLHNMSYFRMETVMLACIENPKHVCNVNSNIYFSAACNRKVQASSSRQCVDTVDISAEDTGHRRSSQLIWAETYLLSDFTFRQVEKRTASTGRAVPG